jgi:hypothetical protein
LARLEAMLAGGRRFLLGGEACIADFSAAQSIWFMRRSPPVAAMLDSYPGVLAWFARVAAFGHGTSTEISGQAAIEVAAGAGGFATAETEADGGFAAGDSVTVTPTDYAHDPVAGQLVGLTSDEVVVERTDARAGRVRVHFPRVGFQVSKG